MKTAKEAKEKTRESQRNANTGKNETKNFPELVKDTNPLM